LAVRVEWTYSAKGVGAGLAIAILVHIVAINTLSTAVIGETYLAVLDYTVFVLPYG
jgi:hypothetical protein